MSAGFVMGKRSLPRKKSNSGESLIDENEFLQNNNDSSLEDVNSNIVGFD
jgi:hypothetical protein